MRGAAQSPGPAKRHAPVSVERSTARDRFRSTAGQTQIVRPTPASRKRRDEGFSVPKHETNVRVRQPSTEVVEWRVRAETAEAKEVIVRASLSDLDQVLVRGTTKGHLSVLARLARLPSAAARLFALHVRRRTHPSLSRRSRRFGRGGRAWAAKQPSADGGGHPSLQRLAIRASPLTAVVFRQILRAPRSALGRARGSRYRAATRLAPRRGPRRRHE